MEGCELSSTRGAGARVGAAGSHLTLVNCNVHLCYPNGVTVEHSGRCVMRDCEVLDNIMNGVWVGDSYCEMTSCVISRNKRNGVYVYDRGSATLTDCTIDSNGFHGVHVHGRTNVTVTRCSLSHNQKWGMVVDQGKCTVRESCMTGNVKGATEKKNEGTVIFTDTENIQ